MVKKHHGLGEPRLRPATLLNIKNTEHTLGRKVKPPFPLGEKK